MKIRTLIAALSAAVALTGAAGAQTGDPASSAATINTEGLGCGDGGDNSGAHERSALRTAPRGAKRVSQHLLVVNLKSGAKRLADRMPYREELDGFHWQYCGYIPALHAHLIGMEDGDLFSGKLLFDRGGPLLDAGGAVYPSPNGKRFLAASTRNGEILDHWVISDLSGKTLWTGLSGLERGPHHGPVIFEEVHWMGNDALRIKAWCNDRTSTRGEGTLTRDGAAWLWKSDLKCAD